MQGPRFNVSDQQKVLNDFQEKSLEMLRENLEVQNLFKELVIAHHPINGLITITHTIKSYMKYMRSHGVKLEKNKPLMTYMSIDQFLKTNKNQLNKQVLLILQKYQYFTPEEKLNKFLFIFQVPYAQDPAQSLKNMVIIENINFFSICNVA